MSGLPLEADIPDRNLIFTYFGINPRSRRLSCPKNLRLMDNAHYRRKRPFRPLFLSKNSSTYQRLVNGARDRI